jgi:hypothetical protein
MSSFSKSNPKETVGHFATTSHKEGTAWLGLLKNDHTYKCDHSVVAESGDRYDPLRSFLTRDFNREGRTGRREIRYKP